MMRRWLLGVALTVLPTFSFSSALHGMDAHQLRRYAAMLGEHASASQWQRLWQATRQRGSFAADGEELRFVLPMRELPAAARKTLDAPDQLEVKEGSQVRVRRDFHPTIIGRVGGKALHGLCLTVDWSDAPAPGPDGAWTPTDMFHVTLRIAEPC